MTDILIDDNNDLAIENGDFVLGYSDNQHQKLIIQANKGDLKEYPELGVGIENLLSSDNYTGILIEIKKNLSYDGMKINNVRLKPDGNLSIDGNY